jgi:hypothetical protein
LSSNETGTPFTPEPVRNSHRIFAIRGVEGLEIAIVGAAQEKDAAARRQHRPELGVAEGMVPHLLASVEVPGLQLADVVGTGRDIERRCRTDIALPRCVRVLRHQWQRKLD